jgi:arylsulfatase A-like enzyme
MTKSKVELQNKKSPLFFTLTFLTVVAIILQIVHVVSQFGYVLSKGNSSVGEYVTNLITSRQLSLLPFVQFLAAQFLLYFTAIIIIYVMTIMISRLFKLHDTKRYLSGLALWLISTIFVVSANSYYFPHSTFAIFGNNIVCKLCMMCSTILLILAITLTFIQIIIDIIRKKRWLQGVCFFTIALSLIWVNYSYTHPVANTFVSSAKKPNIIIIGLDSIRPDHTGYYGNKNIATPNIDKFLASSANFTQAYSALARTYVAWNSILTGKYPKNDQVRDNLIDPASLDLSNTLVTTLKKAGYETIFATDSRQFSLINKQFGFDTIISPKMGIYDFMLSTFNDFPLSNLVMNSAIGAYLFPYNYANRMSYITYAPQTFNKMLNRKLAHRKNQPLFLGIHVILTHWPYMWSEDKQSTNLSLPDQYDNMLTAIDQQFSDMLKILQQNNLLQHAIVVLLSDHGVSLGLHGDRIISIKKYLGAKQQTQILTRYPYSEQQSGSTHLGLDTCSGEGIDILSFNSSNHIILGFKSYGLAHEITKNNSYPVSLIDIAPTILDTLNLPSLNNADGITLKSLIINNTKNENKPRALFFETGIWMPLFGIDDLKHGMINKYIAEKLNTLYGYDSKNNYIIIKSSAIKNLLDSKQRGILYGNWFFSRYPKGLDITSTIRPLQDIQNDHCDFIKTDNGDHKNGICYSFTKTPKPFYVLANTKTGQWTLDLNSAFAKTAPLKLLMQKFIAFYGDEFQR